MSYKSKKEETRRDVLFSLRTGHLHFSHVKYLVESFMDKEEYAMVEGALEAHNEYKKELDEYGYKENTTSN